MDPVNGRGGRFRCGLARVAGLLWLVLPAPPAGAQPGPEHPLLGACAPVPDEACAARLEARALALHGAVREGGRLRTAQGVALAEDPPDEPPRHRLLGPLGDSGLWLLWRRSGEQTAFVTAGPGALPLAWRSPPWPAPGGRHLLVAPPAAPAEDALLALLEQAGGRWRLVWRLDGPPALGYEGVEWRQDGASVRLRWRCASGSPGGAVRLRDGPYGWDLVPALPPSPCGGR